MNAFNVGLIISLFSFVGPEAKLGAMRLRLCSFAESFVISGARFARSGLGCVDADGEALTALLASVALQLLHAEDEPVHSAPRATLRRLQQLLFPAISRHW